MRRHCAAFTLQCKVNHVQGVTIRSRDWIGVAAAAWTIGLAALLCDHLQLMRPVIIGTHTLFGVAASAAICLVLFAKARALEGASFPELRQFTRLVSRWVYILMYALAIMRVVLYLYESSQYCALCNMRGAVPPIRPLDDFQFYVMCCVVPLWVARAAILARGTQSSRLP